MGGWSSLDWSSIWVWAALFLIACTPFEGAALAGVGLAGGHQLAILGLDPEAVAVVAVADYHEPSGHRTLLVVLVGQAGGSPWFLPGDSSVWSGVDEGALVVHEGELGR